MNRTVLAFAVAALLAVLFGVVGTQLSLGSWGFTALAPWRSSS